jgi:hypothetical protein
MTAERYKVMVRPIAFTTAEHCPQKWPTKTGKLWWKCPDPITVFHEYEDGTGAAMCDRHHQWVIAP